MNRLEVAMARLGRRGWHRQCRLCKAWCRNPFWLIVHALFWCGRR